MEIWKRFRGYIPVWSALVLVLVTSAIVYAISWGLTEYSKELGLRGSRGVADVATAYIEDIVPLDSNNDGKIDTVSVSWSIDKPYSPGVSISVEVYNISGVLVASGSSTEDTSISGSRTTTVSLNTEVAEGDVGRIVVTIS